MLSSLQLRHPPCRDVSVHPLSPLFIPSPSPSVLLPHMLREALAPLHCCRVAKQKLLLGGVGGVCARATHKGRLLRAQALSLKVPVALLLPESPPYCRSCRRDRSSDSSLSFACSRSCCTLTLLVQDELVRELSKELEASCFLVARVNHGPEKGGRHQHR
jgi:hypothetical protein